MSQTQHRAAAESAAPLHDQGLRLHTVALAGNPNAGKSTLFNALTGARAHVGNYPGITVEKKVGRVRAGDTVLEVVDLPGAYSLTAYSAEELVARDFLVEERPAAVVDVLNAGALERNLYLTVQFMELGIPLVLGLNMMDEARRNGVHVDVKRLSAILGCPVTELVARTGEGVHELSLAAAQTAREAKGQWKPLEISYGPDLDPAITEMTARILAKSFLKERYPARWIALKYIENDSQIMELGRAADPELAAWLEARVLQVATHLRATLGTYPEAVVADYRYGYIASVLKGVLKRDDLGDRVEFSDRIDLLLTHKVMGPVLMFAVIYLIYQLTFTVGKVPMDWLEAGFGLLSETVNDALPDGMLRSLLVDGVIAGVGGVMGFVPLVMIIFLLIAFLEDSGYMARIAYMLDRVFRIFGLHGCSVMPFIISGGIAGGCALPGVMASRTLRSPKERIATILTAPFMTCGAKLPVFILLAGVFFPDHAAQAMFGMTMLGWAMALCVSWMLRSTVVRGESTPFVMELPPYRLPTLRGLAIHTWERTWQYIKKAGTVILAVSVVVWAAMTFPGLPEDKENVFEARKAEISERIAALEAAEAAQPEAKEAAEAKPDAPAAEARAEEADKADAQTAEAPKAEGEEPAKAEGELETLQAQLEDIEKEQAAAALEASLAGRLGLALEPVSRWAGFDWRTNIALVGGFAAKEIIVSTLGTAYSLGAVEAEEADPLAEKLTQAGIPLAAGLALMVFILLYSPCFPTVVAIGKETGSWKWAVFSMTFNTVFAFVLAVAIFQVGTLLFP
ncbi:Fe(2+) transporter FeoB [Fundidesulfovibrio magnetotacticus]|uniref:Ferrous iron transport protein B n=1 Tax=Fundidesulfovibrio magnetotacticus TaxID=2730080 RepID=A0A6V8LT78_9BACT|nr:ferrous iron transport protein B [Fundidesulfovibrio magnetotacticus]GFK93781.1 Fe(2+) transporter FeoB [Fundidesulfovibrio magnetotacticus]